ncbi:hypothetical protein TNCV_5083981 [Trichonephila clavipes]|nr:hypothetical protein TNCV_5083981 [Trichonephila clavipes]
MLTQPCLNRAKLVKNGAGILEHRTLSLKEGLMQRVQTICKEASLMVPWDHPPQENERFQSKGRYNTYIITEPFPYFPVEQNETLMPVFAKRAYAMWSE